MRILKKDQKITLVVDDLPLPRQRTRSLLESFGMKVSTASNGAEALEKIQRQDYALILMDLGLPDRSGQEVAEAILCWQRQHHRPLSVIAALSAHLSQAEQQRCFAAGMKKAYAKPLTRENVGELLDFI